MATNKTKKTNQDVNAFLLTVEDERKRDDSKKLIEMMSAVTGEKPYMYGPSIIGFGTYHYQYESGHEGDAPLAAFSPRKTALTLYLSSEFPERETLFPKLGKFKATVACVYVKKLDDIDLKVLEKAIAASVKHVRKTHAPC